MIDQKLDNVQFDEVQLHAVRGMEKSIELLEHLDWGPAEIIEWVLHFLEADLEGDLLVQLESVRTGGEADALRDRFALREWEGFWPEKYADQAASGEEPGDEDGPKQPLEGEPQ
jgi:hypothetical protein